MKTGRSGVATRVEELLGDGTLGDRLRSLLTEWYRGARRDLPWRGENDAYRIWISEAMLQQTRVETVLGYYPRFLARLGDFESLANATEDEVVGLWSGLGYYNRARALRRAARVIVEQHGGRFPRDPEVARTLPGVGDYTVGAVLSIAFGLGVALVDGNVARVFARLFAIEESIDAGPTRRLLWGLAQALVPPDHSDPQALDAPGTWNQALMELGATLCGARSVRCDDCPLRTLCAAHRRGLTEELPLRRPKRKTLDVRIEILLARRADQVLLVRRPAQDRMGNMWELPTRELPRDAKGTTLIWPRSPHGPPGLVEPRSLELLGSLSHAITHHRITAQLRAADVSSRWREQLPLEDQAGAAAWVSTDKLEGLNLTGLTRKALRLKGLGK